MAQSLSEILAGLNPEYDVERKPINDQLATLPGSRQAEEAGLETAKTNAFGEIKDSANARGMMYSGTPVDESNRYVGEKYLPAKAAVADNYLNKTTALQTQLAQIGQRQSERAYGIQSDQKSAEAKAAADAAALAIEREKMANDLAIARANQARAAATASSRTKDPAAGYKKGTDAGGGLAYRDAQGNPITSAQYYDAKGATGIGAIIADLRSSKNPGDARIAADASTGKYTYDQLAAKYPYVFGGV